MEYQTSSCSFITLVSTYLAACCRQEVRNGHDDGEAVRPNQVSVASALLHIDETRIQQDMIEMLTATLAKKECENERYRVQQQSLDGLRATYENELSQLRTSSETTRAEFADANQQLERQLQLVQSQYDRVRPAQPSESASVTSYLRTLFLRRSCLTDASSERTARPGMQRR